MVNWAGDQSAHEWMSETVSCTWCGHECPRREIRDHWCQDKREATVEYLYLITRSGPEESPATQDVNDAFEVE